MIPHQLKEGAEFNRWETTASQIGNGLRTWTNPARILKYHDTKRAEDRFHQLADQSASDASLAKQLAEGNGGEAGSFLRSDSLVVDPKEVESRHPTAPVPDIAEADSSFQLLKHRLDDFCLVEHKVRGDGHCQFRSLAFQLSGDRQTDQSHGEVRRLICDHLERHRAIYSPFVNGDKSFDGYVLRMRGDAWGDHLTLQAFADTYCHPVHIVTSYETRRFIQIQPQLPPGTREKEPLLIGFWAEVHYNPVVYSS